jgi:hypothetical protein
MNPKHSDESLLERVIAILKNPLVLWPLLLIIFFLLNFLLGGSSGRSARSLYDSFRRW